jgi:hypothetical protein
VKTVAKKVAANRVVAKGVGVKAGAHVVKAKKKPAAKKTGRKVAGGK